jgi:biopolymer transport protein ExbD
MAILEKKKSKVSDEVPSASMADIAFLLLIFFLVTTTFPKDRGLAIVLPEEGGEVQVSQRNILHIIIQPNGIVEVKRGESTQVQRVPANDIEAIWRQDVSENPNLIAAVKTHPEASYKFMVDVLDALHTAGAERISLQLFEG